MKIFLALLAMAMLAVAAQAQQASEKAQPEANPVSNFVRQTLERQSKNLVAAAEEMPADKYSFRPTPQQMTFGHLVMHMSGSNYFFCSKISGVAAPEREKLTETDPKDKLVAALKSSVDFCTTALAKVDDSNLGDQMHMFGDMTTSRAGAMMMFVGSFADHYGMAAMYLRLNGLLPPTAKEKD
jgi:uncharacterized damage-inducible protein DinB